MKEIIIKKKEVTEKKWRAICVTADLVDQLEEIAKASNQPVSKIAHEIIKEAIPRITIVQEEEE